MRRVQTILAATTVLTAFSITATSLSRADDPFQFGDTTPPSGKTESVDGASSGIQTESDQTFLGAQTTNYAEQLFGRPLPKGNPVRTSFPPTREESTSRPVMSGRLVAGNLGQQASHAPAPGGTPANDAPLQADRRQTLENGHSFLMSQQSQGITPVRFDGSNDVGSLVAPTPAESPKAGSATDRHTHVVRFDTPGEQNEFADVTSSAADPFSQSATPDPHAVARDSAVAVSQGEYTSRFSFADDPAAPSSAVTHRLTEAIPTTPLSDVKASPSSDAVSPAREVDPFAESDFPAPEIRSKDDEEALPVEVDNSARRVPTIPSRTFDSAPAVQPPSVPLERATMLSARCSHDATIVTAAWRMKGPFNVGQRCPCEIVVKNQCGTTAEQVRVETRLPPSLRIVNSVPSASEGDGVLSWQLQDLAPGEQQTIKVLAVADQPGPVEVAAHVRYTASQVQSLTVAEPKLNVALSGPTDVSVGEPASQTVMIHNPGTGVATNIVMEAQVPAGLEHVSGKDLVMQIGSLNPGETRQFRLTLAAVADGPHILQVEARTGSGLVEKATAEINILAPKLKAGIDGPGLRYLGREAIYILRVENEGAAATDAVQMVYHIPEGFEFLRSDRGAQFDEASGTLRWFVGRIGSHQPQELRVTLLATKAGEFVHTVAAISEHGSASEAQSTTRVEGTASLVMKLADLDDPIEIGAETAYDVTITNEGTASAQQVNLTCELPQGLTFIQASGPSPYRAEATTILFEPIATLRAGESIKYRVHVRGTVTGDKRFRCRLTSADLSQPLFTEEFTKFYGE